VATPANVDEQAYKYDPAGNITKQVSTRLGAATPTETQCYTYDTLDRLAAAWTATDDCAATPTSTSHAMVGDSLGAASTYGPPGGFDTLGNRTSQVQHATGSGSDTTTNYIYNGNGNGASQAHALTSTSATGGATGSTAYSYDSVGNMKTRNAGQGNQTLTFDDAGRRDVGRRCRR
jgi:hypothetical protein